MSARITFTITEGTLKGKEYVFEEHTRCVVGRAEDCDIRLPRDCGFADISRHHCVLDVDPPTIRVRDLGSRNGTYVNGEPIGQRPRHQPAEEVDGTEFAARELRNGDEVRVGSTVCRVGIAVPCDTPGSLSFPLYFV